MTTLWFWSARIRNRNCRDNSLTNRYTTLLLFSLTLTLSFSFICVHFCSLVHCIEVVCRWSRNYDGWRGWCIEVTSRECNKCIIKSTTRGRRCPYPLKWDSMLRLYIHTYLWWRLWFDCEIDMAKVEKLYWGNEEHISKLLGDNCDYILCADVMYPLPSINI